MNIQVWQADGHLNADIFTRCVICVLLIATLICLLTGCEITDPDWQARGNIKTMQPTTEPPPAQWDLWK
jgi:hypothetical protein